jgi:tRNA pseudouridine55 synthase
VARRQREGVPELHGIIVVAKPIGPTSHDVVAAVRRLTGVRRVGHGGTLDPFASGVLPVFLGRATRIVEYHMGDPKAYRALVAFGARSTTDDIEGELTESEVRRPDRAEVEAGLAAFRGRIQQVPPAFSAVHVGGRRAYEMAREGTVPELRPRDVEVTRLEVVGWDATDAARPTATLEVECSAGTYIRSLARDLGEALGCGAYLAALERTRSGPFASADAVPLDDVRARLALGKAEDLLLPPDTGLDAFPRVALSPTDLAALSRGQVVRPRPPAELPGSGLLRVVDAAGRLAAIARVDGGRLHPEKVFVEPGA